MNIDLTHMILYKCGFFGALASCSEVARYFPLCSMDATIDALLLIPMNHQERLGIHS